MEEFNLICFDPMVMNGQPCIGGTRLTIRRVLAVIAQYPNRQELRRDYPQLTDEAIRQVLAYAAANLEDRIIPLRTRP
ncbi:MAG: DUF433 domain-containing protein [Phycisphaerales bacterium]